ncbi:MAG: alpha/beta hydrolase [Leptospirales bacterium]|nr:alpha/beta hydrolase [Leptospirales bacterium]
MRIEEENRATFLKREPAALQTILVEGHAVQLAVAGAVDRPPLLLIHGTPGSWAAYARLMNDAELRTRFFFVSVDRPGFGGSESGAAVTELAEQARRIVLAFDAACRTHGALVHDRFRSGQLPIVVGHSWGGPVAARIVMDYPGRFRSMILVAASIDPDLEETKWYQYVGRWPLLRLLVPQPLSVANSEVFVARQELGKLLPRWSELRLPVTVIQGEEDDLVPAANADFAQRMLAHLSPRIERYPGLDHMIPWYQPELIQRAILRQAASNGPAR